MEAHLSEPLSDAFPSDQVSAAITTWWQQELEDALLPDDEPAPPDIMKSSVEIDSHRAVRALLTLEDLLRIKIPESAIKAGGYNDIEEMRNHLMPHLAVLFDNERKKQNAKHSS